MIEQEVASEFFRAFSRKYEYHVHSKASSCGSREPRVIALLSASGDEDARMVLYSVRHHDFELTHLVATARKAHQVIAFEDQTVSGHAEGRS
ncbi:hypothetical protein GCM10017710_22090 [Arthrobacter ramosus]